MALTAQQWYDMMYTPSGRAADSASARKQQAIAQQRALFEANDNYNMFFDPNDKSAFSKVLTTANPLNWFNKDVMATGLNKDELETIKLNQEIAALDKAMFGDQYIANPATQASNVYMKQYSPNTTYLNHVLHDGQGSRPMDMVKNNKSAVKQSTPKANYMEQFK